MGRPRAFDEEKALDRAMKVFWRKGYEGASLSDLTAAMGINSPSLYGAFGSKEGLFKAVLELYDARRGTMLSQILAAPTARDVAARYLFGVADYATDSHHPRGCLLVQAGLSCGEVDVPKQLARHRAVAELALRERFACAKRQGDLPPSADPSALAQYVMTIANGICVQAAAGAGRKELRAIAEMALTAWPASPAPKRRTPKRAHPAAAPQIAD
jgi:AcrR family transcriptional regulator